MKKNLKIYGKYLFMLFKEQELVSCIKNHKGRTWILPSAIEAYREDSREQVHDS